MIEIVSHCFGQSYASLLVYHLSSLVLHKSQPVTMTVISITGDSDVECVLDYFHKIRLPWITWNFISMSADLVYQRPIGRNIAAKASKADVIWFTDCDYVFGNDSLDALCQFPDDNG
ncbi:MAG: glycosyltransferase family 2 protein, partial [Candidatus Cloacimonetes bacterium]|nr:glycosyltransferase family 2 protein [Candidatus Cloacimonadota bacterium]